MERSEGLFRAMLSNFLPNNYGCGTTGGFGGSI